MCKWHAKLDRNDQLQLRGPNLLYVVTAWVRYVNFLQKTLVTLVVLCLNSAELMLTRVERVGGLLLFWIAKHLSVLWLYKLS